MSSPVRRPPPLPARKPATNITQSAMPVANDVVPPGNESQVARAGTGRATAQPPGLRAPKKRLGEVLVAAGVCTDADVQRALEVQKMGGGRLGGILVKLNLVTDTQIREALASQLGVEVVDFDGMELDDTVLKTLPRELVKKYEAIPVRIEGDNLFVAMKDPYNFTAVDEMRAYTRMNVVVLACTEAAYGKFCEEHLETQGLIQEILEGGEFYDRAISSVDSSPEEYGAVDADSDALVHELRLAGEHPPIITLCNFLLVESIQRRASDIHLEPYETYFRVRIRVDGRLQTLLTPPQRLHSAMITRLKSIANMDISVRRSPQDGHISIVYRGQTCCYHVSTLPTVYGEKCVIRLLNAGESVADIASLGLPASIQSAFSNALTAAQGLILVTGPKRSGKTATLRAGLDHINDPETNIVTLEEPVEMSIPGINHVQVNNEAGVTFASGLRSILRQDADVVYLGDMSEPEVAKLAFKAARAGRLVLSTLDSHSVGEAMECLEDMEVSGHFLANAMLLIIAQRSLRKVCSGCKVSYLPSGEEIEELGLTDEQLVGATLVDSMGCEACHDTGYLGQVDVHEALVIDSEIRGLLRNREPVERILEFAELRGMTSLFHAGVEAALKGETTLAEVRRCLSDAR